MNNGIESKKNMVNRDGKKISTIRNYNRDSKGTVIIAHGLGDSKDSDHIIRFGRVFNKLGYGTVRYDARNSFGESEGLFENATLTSYIEDLEDIINDLGNNQEVGDKGIILCGHSLGAISSAVIASKYSGIIRTIIMISSPINYELSKATHEESVFEAWKNSGILTEDWDGFEVKLRWEYMEDKRKYDLLEYAEKLDMPIMIIAGEKDDVTPAKDQKLFFDKLKCEKEFHIIKDGPHTFREEKDLQIIDQLMTDWINKNG